MSDKEINNTPNEEIKIPTREEYYKKADELRLSYLKKFPIYSIPLPSYEEYLEILQGKDYEEGLKPRNNVKIVKFPENY